MTIEEKAKAYDEALAKAREIHRNEDNKVGDMEFIFPELAESAESKNEKIRKELITFVNVWWQHIDKPKQKRWIDWLKKHRYSEYELENEYWKGYDDAKKEQGEKKHVEWSKEDKTMLKELISYFEDGRVVLQHDCILYAQWLKSLQSKNYKTEERETPMSYGKELEEKMKEACKRFHSNDEDSYTLADVFYSGFNAAKGVVNCF